jgi:hypothetical protein
MSAGDWPIWNEDYPRILGFDPNDRRIVRYSSTNTENYQAANDDNLESLIGGIIEYSIRLKYKGWEFSGAGTVEHLEGHPEQLMTDPVEVRFVAPVRICFKKVIYAHWEHFHQGKDQPYAEKVLAFEGTNRHGNPIYGAFLPQDIQLRGIRRIYIPRKRVAESWTFSPPPVIWRHNSTKLLDGLATLLGHNPDSLST